VQSSDHGAPLIVGAGPGGLSVANALARAGIVPRIFERADRVCSTWYGHYDSLRLNSPRLLSSLPGQTIDRRFGTWPRRDDFIDYLERYAQRVPAKIEFGADVRSIDRENGGWRLDTSRGPVSARHVIVAAGLNAEPHLPDWPGIDGFEGELAHGSDYRNADPFRGRSVLVVGFGPTALDAVTDIARGGATQVWLSIRHTPILIRRSATVALLGPIMKHVVNPRWFVNWASLRLHRLLWGDLTPYGIPAPTEGLATQMERRSHGLSIDTGLISAVKQGAVEVVPAVEEFEGPDVLLGDGRRVRPDIVLAATGQRSNLGPLVGHLGVLEPDGRPSVHGGETAPSAPGLYFVGYRLPPPQLADMRFDARAIARAVTRS